MLHLRVKTTLLIDEKRRNDKVLETFENHAVAVNYRRIKFKKAGCPREHTLRFGNLSLKQLAR